MPAKRVSALLEKTAFFSAAGNNGEFLTATKAPGWTTAGAYGKSFFQFVASAVYDAIFPREWLTVP